LGVSRTPVKLDGYHGAAFSPISPSGKLGQWGYRVANRSIVVLAPGPPGGTRHGVGVTRIRRRLEHGPRCLAPRSGRVESAGVQHRTHRTRLAVTAPELGLVGLRPAVPRARDHRPGRTDPGVDRGPRHFLASACLAPPRSAAWGAVPVWRAGLTRSAARALPRRRLTVGTTAPGSSDSTLRCLPQLGSSSSP
jgi:hypothetical protein